MWLDRFLWVYSGSYPTQHTTAEREGGGSTCVHIQQSCWQQLTKRSRTEFMVLLNMTLIIWYSKKHSTIETSISGTEFVAMKIGIKTFCAIQYKLRMMGVPISGASYIYGDNISVIHNTSKPESTLKKSVMQLLIIPSMSLWQWEKHW